MSQLFGTTQLCEIETRIGQVTGKPHKSCRDAGMSELRRLYQQESLRGKLNIGAQNNFSNKNPVYFSSLVPRQD